MASWIFPVLKAVLPHMETIISATKPMFTKPKVEAGDAPRSITVEQQIAELQAASAQNDAHIKEVAEQLQSTVKALQEAAQTAGVKAQSLQRLCVASLVISIVAVCLAVFAVSK